MGFQVSGFRFRSSGFRVSGFRFEVWVSGFEFRVWGRKAGVINRLSRFRGSGFANRANRSRVSGLGGRAQGFGVSGFRVSGLLDRTSREAGWVCGAFRVSGFGFRVPGFEFQGLGRAAGVVNKLSRFRASGCAHRVSEAGWGCGASPLTGRCSGSKVASAIGKRAFTGVPRS